MDNPAPSDAPQPTRRPLWRRVLKWLGITVAVLVALAVALVLFENWRAHRAWARFVAEAAAAGDDLSAESVIPPPVPDGENFAAIPLFKPLFDYDVKKHEGFLNEKVWRDPEGRKRLSSVNPTPDSETTSYGYYLKGEMMNLALLQRDYRADTNFPSQPSPQSAGADVLYALSKYDAEWAQLSATADRPHSQFPHQYDALNLFATETHHRGIARSFVLMARYRAQAHLGEGNPMDARRAIIVGLRFRDALAIEPASISHLVAQALSEMLASPIWAGLVRHEWREDDLIALDEALARTDFFTTGFKAMRAERNAFSFPHLDDMATRPEQRPILIARVDQIDYEPPEMWFPAWFWTAAARAQIVHNKVSIGRLSQRFLSSMDLEKRRVYPAVADEFASEVEALERIVWRKPYHMLGAMMMSAHYRSQMNCCHAATTVDLARVAIALERHRLRHGGFPETLEALDAAVLPIGGLPHDLVTGEPLRYRRTDNGRFDLYAVGWNVTDDGGVTVWKNEARTAPERTQGDWVWPQPKE